MKKENENKINNFNLNSTIISEHKSKKYFNDPKIFLIEEENFTIKTDSEDLEEDSENSEKQIFNDDISTDDSENKNFYKYFDELTKKFKLIYENEYNEFSAELLLQINGYNVILAKNTIIENYIVNKKSYENTILIKDNNYSEILDMKIDGEINCICYIKEKENEKEKEFLIICKEDGIYQLLFYENEILKEDYIKINDMKLQLIIPIEEKKYIISYCEGNSQNSSESSNSQNSNDSLNSQNSNESLSSSQKSSKYLSNSLNSNGSLSGTYIYNGSISSIKKEMLTEKNKISEKLYKIGKIIDKKKVILLNNDDSNKDNLYIFDLVTNKNLNDIKVKINNNYILSNNCILLINNQIFLCCYNNNCILCISIKDENTILDKSYEIKNFQIHCISQIKYYKKILIKKLIKDIDIPEIIEYEYFLVCGLLNNEYIIKLFKLKIFNNEIIMENIKDLSLGEYESKINFIIQLDLHLLIGFSYKKTKKFNFNISKKYKIIKNEDDFYYDYNNSIVKYSGDYKDVSIKEFDFSSEYILQLYSGFFLCHDKNQIFITDKYYSKTHRIHNQNNNKEMSKINYICEIEDKNKGGIFVLKNDGTYYLIFNNELNKYMISREKIDMQLKLLLQLKNNYIISSKEGTFYYQGSLFSLNSTKLNDSYRISKNSYEIGITLNKKIAILMGNFENQSKLEIIDEHKSIKEYNIKKNFILSKNCLSVINENIILCGYNNIDGQNKGIALYKLDLENLGNKLIENTFDIESFDIQCICPIKELIKENIFIFNNLDNDKFAYTSYFLVGGISEDNITQIKVFKINEIENNPKINYIKLIPIDGDFYKIWIVQSNMNGKILIGGHTKNKKLNSINDK